MLSSKQRDYLKIERGKLKQSIQNSTDLNQRGRVNNRIRKADHDIRKKVKSALEDLVLIAEKLPEDKKKDIFNTDIMREFIKAVLKDGDGKNFDESNILDVPIVIEPETRKSLHAISTERERKAGLPEPIYNKRIFDLGTLLADFGINSAYNVISWKLRIRDINKNPSKGEMWNLIDSLGAYGYLFNDLEKDKK